MDKPVRARARLKLGSGIELEAEGEPDFVRAQIQELIGLAQPPRAAQPGALDGAKGPAVLHSAVRQSGQELTLRTTAHTVAKDACLILLLASERLLDQPRPTAAMLARWLRKSGYAVERVDRTLGFSIKDGKVLPTGTRRARRYELSAKGRLQALLAAEKVARIAGDAD